VSAPVEETAGAPSAGQPNAGQPSAEALSHEADCRCSKCRAFWWELFSPAPAEYLTVTKDERDVMTGRVE
jgi:hypothetical protein